MIYENEKIWFQLKRLWVLFPFVLILFLYLLYLSQFELRKYVTHKEEYRIAEAEIINLDIVVDKGFRGKNYSYYSEIEVLNNTEQTYVIVRDTRDYIGRKIKVAVNIHNSNDVCRLEWLRPKDEMGGMLYGCAGTLVLLLIGKVLSYFNLKKVYYRIDSLFEEEVEIKRKELEKIRLEERGAIVKRIRREANDIITMETVQIQCSMLDSDRILKSPKMLGHTFLKEGDYIKLDNSKEEENYINWTQYFI